MQVGILGAGAIGSAFARRLATGGHEAILSNSRAPETLAGVVAEIGPGVVAGTRFDAGRAEIVVLAVPRDQVTAVLNDLTDWDGRILVDATNDFAAPPLRPGQVTSSEHVAALAPGARVLKALNHLFAADLAADPRQAGGRRVLFVSGDDDAAKKAFIAVLDDLGYAPIDLGGLAEGGRLHQARGGPLVGQSLVSLAAE